MSWWAEAFRASIRSRVASVDTSPPDRTTRPPTPPPCVNSVSSVTGPGHTQDAARRPLGDELSTVSAVSRAKRAVSVTRGRTALLGRTIAEGYRQSALQRPPSWADLIAPPMRGCFCSCCKGQRWWRECDAPKGWRCSTCHPPNDLPAEAMTEVRT
jgi:hypothetical protein